LVLEHKKECELIKIAHLIMNSEEYQLNVKYMEMFLSSYKLAARIMIICRKMVLILIYINVFIFTIIAYFDNQMNFSIIIMSIWFVIVILTIFYGFSAFFISCLYTYVLSLYIQYRFRQVNDSIEIYLKKGNTF